MPSLNTWLLAALTAVQVASGAPQGVSHTARCGPTFGLTCKSSSFGDCCSKYGYCGSTKDYCGDGCQAGWGSCRMGPIPSTPATTHKVSKDGSCGQINGRTCQNSEFGNCCSEYGYCGSTSKYCGKGCNALFGQCSGAQSSKASSTPSQTSIPSVPSASPSSIHQISSNARCGNLYNASPKGMTCKGSKYGNCCSQYSYCGSTKDYCGSGCQPGFGDCDALPSSRILSSSTIRTSIVSSSIPSSAVVSSSSASSSAVSASSTQSSSVGPSLSPSSSIPPSSSTALSVISSTPAPSQSSSVVSSSLSSIDIISSTTEAASSTPITICSSTPLPSSVANPPQIIETINLVKQKSQALQQTAQSITIVNGPLIIVGQGPFPTLIAGLNEIVTIINTASQQLPSMSDVTNPAEAQLVNNAFRELVRIQQALLNILIGKAGLFSTVPFIGQPVAEVLRMLETAMDAFSQGLVGLVNDPCSDIAVQANSLLGTIRVAITSYEGLATSTKRSIQVLRREIAAAA